MVQSKRAGATARRYQVFIKDVTVGSWVIEAESEDTAREIADARLGEGDSSWHTSDWGQDGYIEIDEIRSLD